MSLSLRTGAVVVVLAALCAAPSLWSVAVAAADSPVADAAVRGDVETVRALLERGADVQTARPDGMTALHWAAMRSDLEMAGMLLYAGANLEATTRIGQHTPLHVAGRSGEAEVVQALLEAGADPHAESSSGATPLHLAAQAGNAAAVAALLDHGADVNARERTWGQTPLMFAAASNRLGPVNVLMERGADLDVATNIVDLPALDAMDRAAAARRKQVLDGFRAAAPPDERQGWRPTASEVQAAIRAAREVQLLDDIPDFGDGAQLERGTPRAYTERVGVQGGLTALLHAARQGHAEVAMALLYAGADVNRASGDGTTPLQIATMNGHFDLALRLVERGADPNVTTAAGATPLFAALNLQWAPRARYPQPRAHDQQEATYLDVMAALLEAGADPNVRLAKHLWYMSYNHCCSESVDGATPFWRAAYATDVEAMKLLRAYGADPHVPTRAPEPRRRRDGEAAPDPSGLPPVEAGDPGVWPIHAASGVGYGEGFESNAHRHVPDGWLPSVRYLVEEIGVDVNIRDHEGYTALHHAAARGDTGMVRYLVDQGADVMVVSRRGQTTADMANGPYQRTLPFPETLALLEGLGAVNNDNCVSC